LEEELKELDEAVLTVDRLDALVDIVYVAIGAMWKLGLPPEGIIKAIHIVCDSNDSKSIQRTAPDVKANGRDKGSTFIPPEPALRALLKEYGIYE
jgi:predicted HAD superfamily Cof-like phosphohydrolase